jgi:hypothetical protein
LFPELDCFVGYRLLAMTLVYAGINKNVIASRAAAWRSSAGLLLENRL